MEPLAVRPSGSLSADAFDGSESETVLREAWVEDFNGRVRIALSRLPAGEGAR